ncbi:MAG: hypothetical protein QXF57_02765, partial [Acidilobaceae archaeon]
VDAPTTFRELRQYTKTPSAGSRAGDPALRAVLESLSTSIPTSRAPPRSLLEPWGVYASARGALVAHV